MIGDIPLVSSRKISLAYEWNVQNETGQNFKT